jgi:uncharacterized protein with beta-barrel porin domain
MASVVRADARRAARLAARSPTELVVSVAASGGAGDPVARIGVSVRDKALATRLAGAMTRAVRAVVSAPLREVAVVRVRSRKALERLGGGVDGAIAVVPLTARNLRRAGEVVEALRAAGAAGVQLAWDGREPSREAAEAKVFAILERARATPGQAPVVLAHGEEPVEALRILIAHRR